MSRFVADMLDELGININEKFRLYNSETKEFYGERALGSRNVFYIDTSLRIMNINSCTDYSSIYPLIFMDTYTVIPVSEESIDGMSF